MLTGRKRRKEGWETYLVVPNCIQIAEERKKRRGRWEVLIENNLVTSIASSLEKSIFGRIGEKMFEPTKNSSHFSLPTKQLKILCSSLIYLLCFLSFIFHLQPYSESRERCIYALRGWVFVCTLHDTIWGLT